METSEQPRILEIQIATKAGGPMFPLQTARILNTGIKGDRYAHEKGHFSNTRKDMRPISLIESEVIEKISVEERLDMTFAYTRRNLLTIGVKLNDLLGKQFHIGEVLVEGVELCAPCRRPDDLAEKFDVRPRFQEVFKNCGGLRVKIISTGEMYVGDPIIYQM